MLRSIACDASVWRGGKSPCTRTCDVGRPRTAPMRSVVGNPPCPAVPPAHQRTGLPSAGNAPQEAHAPVRSMGQPWRSIRWAPAGDPGRDQRRDMAKGGMRRRFAEIPHVQRHSMAGIAARQHPAHEAQPRAHAPIHRPRGAVRSRGQRREAPYVMHPEPHGGHRCASAWRKRSGAQRSKQESTQMLNRCTQNTQMDRSPAWSFTAGTARPNPGSCADTVVHVPSACFACICF
jgi:hypothetical protein